MSTLPSLRSARICSPRRRSRALSSCLRFSTSTDSSPDIPSSMDRRVPIIACRSPVSCWRTSGGTTTHTSTRHGASSRESARPHCRRRRRRGAPSRRPGPSQPAPAAAGGRPLGAARLLLPVSQCAFQMTNILQQLQRDPSPGANDKRAQRCSGVALSVAVGMPGRWRAGDTLCRRRCSASPSLPPPMCPVLTPRQASPTRARASGGLSRRDLVSRLEHIRSHHDIDKDNVKFYNVIGSALRSMVTRLNCILLVNIALALYHSRLFDTRRQNRRSLGPQACRHWLSAAHRLNASTAAVAAVVVLTADQCCLPERPLPQTPSS